MPGCAVVENMFVSCAKRVIGVISIVHCLIASTFSVRASIKRHRTNSMYLPFIPTYHIRAFLAAWRSIAPQDRWTHLFGPPSENLVQLGCLLHIIGMFEEE
jgi:hypothetical protein